MSYLNEHKKMSSESQKGFQMEFQTVTKVTRLKCFPSAGADLGGGCRGCAPPAEMTRGFQLVFWQKKKICGLLVLK